MSGQRYLSGVTPAGNEARNTIANLISKPAPPPPAPGALPTGAVYTPPGGVPAGRCCAAGDAAAIVQCRRR